MKRLVTLDIEVRLKNRSESRYYKEVFGGGFPESRSIIWATACFANKAKTEMRLSFLKHL